MDMNLGAFALLPWPIRLALVWIGVGWFLALYKAKRDSGLELWPAIGWTIRDGLLPPWTAIVLIVNKIRDDLKKK